MFENQVVLHDLFLETLIWIHLSPDTNYFILQVHFVGSHFYRFILHTEVSLGFFLLVRKKKKKKEKN